MKVIKEIKVQIDPKASRDVKGFLRSKGYQVCEVVKTGTNWKAVLIKNSDFVIATVLTKNKEMAGI